MYKLFIDIGACLEDPLPDTDWQSVEGAMKKLAKW